MNCQLLLTPYQMDWRVPKIEDARAYTERFYNSSLSLDRPGEATLVSLFSSEEFQRRVNGLIDGKIGLIMSNFEEYTPFPVLQMPEMSTTVLEAFETSVKMFDRGMTLFVTYSVYDNPGVSRNQRLVNIVGANNQITRYQAFNKLTSELYVNSHWNQLIAYHPRTGDFVPLMMPVIRTKNLPFVMALRRHRLRIPLHFIEIHVSEYLSGKLLDYEALRKLYRKDLYWSLLNRKMRIIEKSPKEMSKYIYRPEAKFASITELKEEMKEVWKETQKRLK